MTQSKSKRFIATAGAIALTAALGLACSPSEPEPEPRQEVLPYATEYPGVAYSSREPQGALGRLAAAVNAGTTTLRDGEERNYLDAVLAELGIDASSQTLVFSRTSLQTRQIHPTTPRAIYFNDDTYVAWVPDAASLELSAYDPELGPVFYRLAPGSKLVSDTNSTKMVSDTNFAGGAATSMERQFGTCLRCHDTYGLSGGGVPRFLLGSGYTGTEGELVSHEAWILTSQATPLRSRWGGWYVTGSSGQQVHLGNIVVQRPEDLRDLESLRVMNVDDLSTLLDTSPYLTPYSDIVALMVLEHQVEVHNLISRLRFEAASASGASLEPHVDALLEAMLMADEIALTDTVIGGSGFSDYFQALGPFDPAGRSLRELDLTTRLFRYPLSYLIYSDAFQALPATAKSAVYGRLRAVLEGPAAADEFPRLSDADRTAIREILSATLPEALEP